MSFKKDKKHCIAVLGSEAESLAIAVSMSKHYHVFLVDLNVERQDIIQHHELHTELAEAKQQGQITVVDIDALVDVTIHIDELWCFVTQLYQLIDFKSVIQKLEQHTTASPSIYLSMSVAAPLGSVRYTATQFPSVHVLALPLFIRESTLVQDFCTPDLLVLGGDAADVEYFEVLLQAVVTPRSVHRVSYEGAELIRISLNAMLATRISFINELAILSDKLSVPIAAVENALTSDHRIGGHYLKSGVGFGGSKFHNELSNYESLFDHPEESLIYRVRKINDFQQEYIFSKLWRYYAGELKDRRVGILGGAYKPNSASTENSALHKIVDALSAQKAIINIYDPMANAEIKERYGAYPHIFVYNSQESLVNDSDCVLIITAWEQFKGLVDKGVTEEGGQKPVFDGVQLYSRLHLYITASVAKRSI